MDISEECEMKDDINNDVVVDKLLQTKIDKNVTGNGRGVTFCTRVRTDRRFRCRLLHTACTTWAMVSFGITQTMIGLAFPDLMLIINKDVADASWIFTAWSFGSMVGSLLAGFLYDRLNKLAVLIALSLGLVLTTSVTPWCSYFPLMLIVHLLGGGFASAIHSTVTADTLYIWKSEKEVYLQIVHLAASVGGIFSPLFVSPFLSSRHQDEYYQNITAHSEELSNNYSQDISSVPKPRNYNFNLTIATRFLNGSDDVLFTTSTEIPATVQPNNESQLYYAYALAAGFTLVGAILYLLVHGFSGDVYSREKITRDHNIEANSNNKTNTVFTRKAVLFLVFIVSIQLMFYVTLQRHEYGLFMTYAIRELHWSKNKASSILAIFWCVFCLGRVIAMCALRIFKEDKLNWFYMIVMSFGMVGFAVSSIFQESTMIIICLYISAFGMAPLFTFMLSWFSSHITLVTGRITGVVYVFMAIGSMTVPVISGHLMDNVSYNWYLYVLVVLLLLYVCVTIFLRISYRKQIQKRQRRS